jgi:N utilization substance protein A
MNPTEILRIVDAIHRDKNINQEIVFEGIESALVSALEKYYGEDSEVVVKIDRENGNVNATCNEEVLDSEEVVGRIGAQTAKQVMIQKIREAERDALHEEYSDLQGYMVSGMIQRYEGGAATVALSNCEAILPRSEQIPGETHHANERVRATVYEVRKAGSRVKVILSRRAPQLVQRLFEQEIPEIAEGVIEIKAMSREPGYRSKVAVISSDQRIDCVGACVGVRGNRIKNIVDELAGERIDIVRWDENLEVLIPNALQPAEVEQVILCKMLGRAIVLVREDQLSLAIGRRGQNVRLASKLSGWDIEIMTQEELAESIDRAVDGFSGVDGVKVELAERLVEEGFLSYDDLSIIEPDALMEMGGLSEEQVNSIVEVAETRAQQAEAAAQQARRDKKERERLAVIANRTGQPLESTSDSVEPKKVVETETPADLPGSSDVEPDLETGDNDNLSADGTKSVEKEEEAVADTDPVVADAEASKSEHSPKIAEGEDTITDSATTDSATTEEAKSS